MTRRILFNSLFVVCLCAYVWLGGILAGMSNPDSAAGSSNLIFSVERGARKGDYFMLRDAPLEALDSAALAAAKPGALYYLGRLAARESIDRTARFLFEEAFRYEREPWRREAGLRLFELAVGTSEAVRLAAAYPSDTLLKGRLVRALVDAGHPAAAAGLAGDMDLSADAAVLAASAAALHAGGSPRWTELWRRLFFDHPAGEAHTEAMELIDVRFLDPQPFDAWELSVFEFKERLAARDHRAAHDIYRRIEDEVLAQGGPGLIADVGVLMQHMGRFSDGARRLEQAGGSLEGRAGFLALEHAGRLYRSAGAYEQAIGVLERALRSAPDRSGGDRALWLLMNSLMRRSPEEFVRRLGEFLPAVGEPGFFSDLFERLCSVLVHRGDWPRLRAVYEALARPGFEQERARYSVVLAAAIGAGLYRPRPELEVRRMLEDVLEGPATGYYRIIAALALRRPEAPSAVPEEHQPRAYDLDDLYILGFLDYGMEDEALSEAGPRENRLHPDVSIRLAAILGARGRSLESLRMTARAKRRPGYRPTRKSLETAFPAAFSGYIDEVVRSHDLPRAVFYALVREESHFDPDISSHAGAVGLAQLMPATARDIAVRLRIRTPDLTDPAVNLALGGWYLNRLLARFDALVPALAAYNAGQGRVTTWLRARRGSSYLLFAEALPFFETRHYIRKIFVSAFHYGYLYGWLTPEETLNLFFPEFARMAL